MTDYRDFETDPPEDESSPGPTPNSEPEFDDAACLEQGKALAKRETNTRWDIGKWLVEGEPHCPDFSGIKGAPPKSGFYDIASETIGLAPGKLKEIASTYRRAVSVRTDACSWSHHRVLVNALEKALPNADEKTGTEWLKKWLDKAAEDKLSVAALKDAVKAEIRMRSTNPSPLEKAFLVTVPLDVWKSLKEIADGDSSSVQEYAAGLLSGFAASPDGMLQRDIAKKTVKERRHEQRQRAGQRLQRAYPGRHFGS